MKRLLVALALLAVAEPALAQVHVGQGHRTRRPPRHHVTPAAAQPQHGLTTAEEDQLIAAQDQVADIDVQIAGLQQQVANGTPLTAEQQAYLQTLQTHRQSATDVITALSLKLEGGR